MNRSGSVARAEQRTVYEHEYDHEYDHVRVDEDAGPTAHTVEAMWHAAD